MLDLADGQWVEMKGSGAKPYVLKNVGGVYSCTCPAWRNQSIAIERRTCKHLCKLRGEAPEQARVGQDLPPQPERTAAAEEQGGPPVLLAERWDNAQDLSGWWMSEKLDGVRAYWNGTSLISRLGNRFHAPGWFVAGLPAVPLDGELWIARRAFQRTVGIVRRQDTSDLWKEVAYVIFDAPTIASPFEDRLAFVREHAELQPRSHIKAHEHVICRDLEHLHAELSRVEALGGEGLMMREPASRYAAGRSTTLLKIKSFHDAEARVIEHLKGAGRHKGRMGALQVQLADGTIFSVGTGFSDRERENPPQVGSVITFRYQELSDGGVPRFPSYVGVRADLHEPAAQAPAGNLRAPDARAADTWPVPLSSPTRRFELVEGTSSKFWEVSRNGCDVTVRYGRIGSDGQTNAKMLADEAMAAAHAADLIRQKENKGYRSVSEG
jgi:DNA ligase-1